MLSSDLSSRTLDSFKITLTQERSRSDRDATSKILEGVLYLKEEFLRMKKEQTQLNDEVSESR